MAKVVFVHGVGKQYLSEDSLARDLVPELRGGVRLARAPVPEPEDVAIAFYGDLFRPRGGRAGPSESFDASDVESDEEYALLMEWWAQAARTDPGVPAPDESGGRGPAGRAGSQLMRLQLVRAALDALTGAQFLTGMLDRVLISDLKQLVGYLTDDDIRERAKARLAARITPETRVVVAHSLGSVIAYETLCDETLSTGRDVHMLVTLGSPLGMRGLVLPRLRPEPAAGGLARWPRALRRWTNIADATDIVAVVRELRPAFGSRVTDVTVHNGSHMHEATRYLTAVETGRAIAAGLSGAVPDAAERQDAERQDAEPVPADGGSAG
ncbi:antibiotic ABC transporter ATP-binding protein [Streptomyces inhibens]|uniref:antibiotic ABC transporter ATP-binding protein n=1 Tax=Streptomyces inhibens TaxID=2293571 RepID=UPI001EE6CEA9|nr:antibiotic ABC transporter ATP-binding protein [Streptomyces inhibens]UKY53734.1 antibiotic ABC transporter ATP-binding protein [Streptomyces inhibens]